MDRKSVVAELDERQPPQAVERILRGHLGQHRGEQRERWPADDRGGIEDLASPGIEDAEIDLGQALDDRLDRHGLEADVRPLRQRGSGESKGQGMTACKSVDRSAASPIQTVLDEEGLGGVARKVLEGHAAEEDAKGARPARHRRLAPRHDDPHVVAQGRHERLAEPRVQEPQELVRVDDDDDPSTEAAQPGRRGLGGREVAACLGLERGKEPSCRGLDRATIQIEHRRPGAPGLDAERLDQRRLADPRDAMDEDDEWATLAEQAAEDAQLVVPPDEPGGLFVHQVTDGLRHALSVLRVSIKPRPGSARG